MFRHPMVDNTTQSTSALYCVLVVVNLTHKFACSLNALGPGLPSGWPVVRSVNDSYLVDPASSHMLMSKIKPCMSKYKHLYCETANGSLNQL
jgi:hypothetical protein